MTRKELEDEMERTYQQITAGFVEPELMYLLGATLKEWGTVTHDSSGAPIEDNAMYELTKDGIWRVD